MKARNFLRINSLSLQAKMVVSIILILLLGLGGSCIFFYQQSRHKRLSDLELSKNSIINRLVGNLSKPIWDLDKEQSLKVLKSEMPDQNVSAIVVYEKDKKTVFAAVGRDVGGRVSQLDEDVISNKFIEETSEISFRDETIAFVRLCLTVKHINKEISTQLLNYILIFSSLLVIVAGLLTFLIRKMIIQRITKIKVVFNDIARGAGDLTQRINISAEDEVGELSRLFNTFLDKLNDIILQVKVSTDEVSATTKEVNSTSVQLTTGADQQTSQTNEVAVSAREMMAAIVDNSKTASQTSEYAEKASVKAREGAEVMQATRASMEEIVNSTEKTGKVVGSLSDRTNQIGEIISVIDDIADQTNLLALNAAIEAARAGEQGRGFAVVADEVRKLAERTTKATKEISDTIQAIQDETRQVDESMVDAGATVNKGKAAIVKTEEVFSEIVQSVTQAMDMIKQIASASEEQSAGAEEISRNVDAISTVAKQTAGGAEQMALAAERLNRQADALRNLVNRFKLRDEAVRNGSGDGETGSHEVTLNTRAVSKKDIADVKDGIIYAVHTK